MKVRRSEGRMPCSAPRDLGMRGYVARCPRPSRRPIWFPSTSSKSNPLRPRGRGRVMHISAHTLIIWPSRRSRLRKRRIESSRPSNEAASLSRTSSTGSWADRRPWTLRESCPPRPGKPSSVRSGGFEGISTDAPDVSPGLSVHDWRYGLLHRSHASPPTGTGLIVCVHIAAPSGRNLGTAGGSDVGSPPCSCARDSMC